jgi:hypothetical protein
MQIELATTSNKNVQQQDAKRNTVLQTKWTKTTWKTLKRLLHEAETGLLRPNSWRMMMRGRRREGFMES